MDISNDMRFTIGIAAAISYTTGAISFFILAIITIVNSRVYGIPTKSIEADILYVSGCVLYLLGSVLFLISSIRQSMKES